MLNRSVLTPMLAAGLAAFAMLWLISPIAAQEAPREECSDCLESDVLTEESRVFRTPEQTFRSCR